MTTKPERVEHEILLLVEGKDARNFFDTLREHLELADVRVRDFGGVRQLRPYLAGLVSAPGFRNVRRLGIVRDAETSDDPAGTPRGRFRVCDPLSTTPDCRCPHVLHNLPIRMPADRL